MNGGRCGTPTILLPEQFALCFASKELAFGFNAAFEIAKTLNKAAGDRGVAALRFS